MDKLEGRQKTKALAKAKLKLHYTRGKKSYGKISRQNSKLRGLSAVNTPVQRLMSLCHRDFTQVDTWLLRWTRAQPLQDKVQCQRTMAGQAEADSTKEDQQLSVCLVAHVSQQIIQLPCRMLLCLYVSPLLSNSRSSQEKPKLQGVKLLTKLFNKTLTKQ